MTAMFDVYAKYYDELYKDKDYRAEAQYVASLRPGTGDSDFNVMMAPKSILDLGCGTGRHDMALADMGFTTLGVDQSEKMIELALANASAYQGQQVAFATGDVRTVRFGCLFGTVISLFHVASYMTTDDDMKALINTAAAHLHVGGVFVFDFWYGPAVLRDLPKTKIRHLDDKRWRISESVMHPNVNCIDVHYTILNAVDDHTPFNKIFETHRMRYWFLPELAELLGRYGFEILTAEKWMGGALGFDSWYGCIAARKVT